VTHAGTLKRRTLWFVQHRRLQPAVPVVPDIMGDTSHWAQGVAAASSSDTIEITAYDRDVERIRTSEQHHRRAHHSGHEEWQQHQAAIGSRSRRTAGDIGELGLQNETTEGLHLHRNDHPYSRWCQAPSTAPEHKARTVRFCPDDT
jgi:hypothetical protein